MTSEQPIIENLPFHSLRHGQYSIEGWSRAGVQSYWRIPELKIGFDLGGIPWDFHTIPTWFISHGHLDHLLALPILLTRRWMMKLSPPTVYVPTAIVEPVKAMLAAWQAIDRGEQPCTLLGLQPGESVALSDKFFVRAFPTVHKVPSQGYIVWERRQKLKSEFQHLTGQQLVQQRQAGVAVTSEVPVPILCYTGDTGSEGLETEPALYDAKILITELSFARPEHSRESIRNFGHLHVNDFAERADRFRNELIIGTHITTRQTLADFQALVHAALPLHLLQRLHLWGTV